MRFTPFAVALLVGLSFAAPAYAGEPPEAAGSDAPVWPFETSDIEPDPGFVFGRLDNGMRYIVRTNDRPEGTALVRLHIGSGSLSETESERGLAHFVEHMAFNGSKRIPEGEMIKLLEREGLAFGADTNASTGFEATTYKLDLPRNEPALLDTALMLMRETASELTLSPEAIDRERGVILAERRDRNTYALKELIDRLDFAAPGALHTQRLPIGLPEVLEGATDADLRGFYAREYVPANAVLVVVGDYPAEAAVSAINRHFADWRPAPMPAEPDIGPIDLARGGVTDIFLDPALSEAVTVSRLAPWQERSDSIATRRDNLIRSLGYDIVNRRLARLAAQADPPFRSAGFGTGDVFEDARTTNLTVNTIDGGWQRGLDAAADTLRTALAYGFSPSEVAEQLATTRTALENSVASAETRTNAALVNSALALIEDELVPSTPEASLARFESFAGTITPEQVLAALLDDAATLADPLIRFRGRAAPEGGERALRDAWNAAVARPMVAPEEIAAMPFAYTRFGPQGAVASDRIDERIGLRAVSFANGVRLNLKTTALSKDRISFRMHLDGGSLLDTRQNPNATAMVNFLTAGGLGAHSQDELATILAGRTVSFGFGSAADSFSAGGTTTPRDLELQLQLLAALLSDPGYRPEGESRFRQTVANFYKTLDATPAAAYSSAIGGILSDNDPRFSLQSEETVAAQSFDDLEAAIGDRLASGAIELTLVGDFDEATAIDLVARTLGALPSREGDFLPRAGNRDRRFTADRSLRTIPHRGEPDQAMLRLIWPTTDDSDLELYLTMELLERIAQLELQDELRERLGQAYSPDAGSSQSSIYPGYGTFSLTASLDVGKVDDARAAMQQVVERLRSEATDPDTLERARRPLLEQFDNALKSNGGWLSLVDRAQSKPHEIDRFLAGKDGTLRVTPEMIRAAAESFLTNDGAVEIRVLPRTGPEPE
ncbi:M16 family metallopeptidase [Parerythrobacter lacustris]|uniref:Insulinase family protein n=1 Tax=Parerythrobacter lacustris TaxID=2969984 RepID=A0ABT1XTS0_9SPHN|nr:insulinase family protein [Parerythrobacter lacustris]MCR2835043.1 insulinase family protein [Parerythrobacter lacustris]